MSPEDAETFDTYEDSELDDDEKNKNGGVLRGGCDEASRSGAVDDDRLALAKQYGLPAGWCGF